MIILGLGNPGKEYQHTRHNMGFEILNDLQKHFRAPAWKEQKRLNALIAETTWHGASLLLAKPTTYMNRSGNAAQKLLEKYQLPPNALLVIHDDKDIAWGRFKLQKEKSSAGHRGVQSIIESLRTNNFFRLRIGIQNAAMPLIPAEKWVLGRFTTEEKKQFLDIKKQLITAVETLIVKK